MTVSAQNAEGQLRLKARVAGLFSMVAGDELYNELLAIILEVTNSPHGIVAFVDEQNALVCPTLTREIWDACAIEDKAMVFPREVWGGIWGRALIDKKAQLSNEQFAVPNGHLPVERALVVPLVHDDKAIGHLLVGNKAQDYTQQDQQQLQFLADAISPMLFLRLQRERQQAKRVRAEEELRRAHAELEERVSQRTEELRLAVEQLRDSGMRFRALADATPEGIALHEDGRILLANNAMARMFGYTSQELVAMSASELAAPESRELVVNNIRSGNEQPYEALALRKDKTTFSCLLSATNCSYQGRQVRVTAVRDLTEQKRMEVDRAKMEERIRQTQKLESLGVLAGGIAHDFNNLLLIIMGNAHLALAKMNPESPGCEHIKKVEIAAKRAAELTNEMLAYSGKGQFVVESLNLSTAVEEMAHLLDTVISKNAVLKYDFAPKLPMIEGDAAQIRQVLMNLITNASDALGELNGVITIVTGVVEVDSAYFAEAALDWHLSDGPYVFIEVSDTGCGMDAATQKRVFDPFFSTKFTGRGLGLAAVQGIVRGHKGAVRIYSEVGVGSTFKVLLPAADDLECCVSVRPRPAEGWTGSGLILIVDDEAIVREVVGAMLRAVGFDVLVAEDGVSAVRFFQEHAHEIRAVLLDMTMPNMGGEETFRELRRIDPDVRVVLSSGYNEKEATSRFAGKGLAGFIQKPYTVDALAAILRGLLEST